VKREIPPYEGGGPSPVFTEWTYGVEAATSRSWTEEEDALGNRTGRYTDAFRHEVEIALGYATLPMSLSAVPPVARPASQMRDRHDHDLIHHQPIHELIGKTGQ
jgi:hypothetical protein